MTVYLLHIDPPLKHARHYIGFTNRTVEERLDDHTSSKGSPLIAAAIKNGSSVTVGRIWNGEGRELERRLKKQKNSRRHCTLCSIRIRSGEKLR
jgi:predicted GIY-YIG superfamily endonuclease